MLIIPVQHQVWNLKVQLGSSVALLKSMVYNTYHTTVMVIAKLSRKSKIFIQAARLSNTGAFDTIKRVGNRLGKLRNRTKGLGGKNKSTSGNGVQKSKSRLTDSIIDSWCQYNLMTHGAGII